MTTDTTERGLEELICTFLTGSSCEPSKIDEIAERPAIYDVGWMCSAPADYDREYCVDLVQLAAFLRHTQPKVTDALSLDDDGPTRQKFLARLRDKVGQRGVIDVLRHGIKHGVHSIDIFYGTPSPENDTAKALFEKNRFTVTRQLQYSKTDTHNALDLCLLINGLPIFTFELKNNLTKQNVKDAMHQYKRDRDPREKLFGFGRCVAHFALDESEVHFCTHLEKKASWFLPFNRGYNNGAGNPPNPNGLKTDYLWKDVLTRSSLTNIIDNYAQIVETQNEKTRRKVRKQIWPRYHQWDLVQCLLADVAAKGAGQRYLLQHSAGSGKSNSIAWLAHQLIDLKRDGAPVFDSIILVTDRLLLDQQIHETVKQFTQVNATVGRAGRSDNLRKFIEDGKKIIISTVQKFPFIYNEIGDEQRGRNFAIIIDEAHSSQGGKASGAMSAVLGQAGERGEAETYEDQINRVMESRKMLPNASYFAFTATPKHRTLELFGAPEPQTDGTVKHRAFHSYTMKQAIDEGFILDVLKHYTPVNSYYKLAKTVEDDPEFDVKKAQSKLRRYVEGDERAIRIKAEIMVDHFHEQVLARRLIGGQARAMVVTNGIHQAIQYFHAIKKYLIERKSQHQAIVAFSGEHQYGGKNVTEASLNGFSSKQIAKQIQDDPYRFLICADKFQTGYDEPLLHSMYVDKILAGIKAVQTLSRLNRAHPKKHNVCVLDFTNDTDTIRDSFADYYRTTILSEETDPDKLHDLKADLDAHQVYAPEQINNLARLYLGGAERDQLDPILDVCVVSYQEQLDENGQVDFKGKAKAFIRAYGFLSAILPYTKPEWEELSIFLNFLVPKLSAPIEEDLSKGILELIDMDSYRIEKQAVEQIGLPDQDAEIAPLPPDGGGGKPEPQMDRLSNIVNEFNNLFGNIGWSDADLVRQRITEDIPQRVSVDPAYQNARENSDKPNARIEHDKVLTRVMMDFLRDDTELFKQFTDNADFKRWVTKTVFDLTYNATEESRAP